jgi:stage V sporulation protein G
MRESDCLQLIITEVRITPQRSGALAAFASITLNDLFTVHGLKIIIRPERRFVAMPSRRRADDSHCDVAHPIRKSWRDYMEAAVLEAYDRMCGAFEDDLQCSG